MTWATVLGVAVGCGGQSERTSGDSGSDGGSGGTVTTGGTGGSEAGGTSGTDAGGVGTGGVGTGGTGGGRSCLWDGRTYEDGTSFSAGCNTCTCSDGAVGCTTIACPPEEDCASLSEAYAAALAWAKTCQPNAEFQCRTIVMSGLQCGCPTYANEPAAIDVLGEISAAWNNQSCGGGVVCGPCPPTPLGASCSGDGVCLDMVPM